MREIKFRAANIETLKPGSQKHALGEIYADLEASLVQNGLIKSGPLPVPYLH